MSFPAITLVTTSTGPSMITLSSIVTIDELGQQVAGTTYVIRDRDGFANSNPITIFSGSNTFGTPQYFQSGTTSNQSFLISEPFGFATITEQSHYTYRIESASTYPQGATNILTQQLTVSTGTAIPNIIMQDTHNTNAEYGLFVSSGSLLFQTINSMTPSVSSVVQVTNAQYISTISSVANIFETSSIYTSSFLTQYISTRYVVASTVISSNPPIIDFVTNQTGQICTANISANTVDTKSLLSALTISSGLISALQGFVTTVNLSNINTNFFSVLTQSYIKTGIASNISAGVGNITSNTYAYYVSTDRFFMSSLTSDPDLRKNAQLSSIYTTDIQSVEANISTISTISFATRTIHNSKVLTTSTISSDEISTNTIVSAFIDCSTFRVSTLFTPSTTTSTITTSTMLTNTISSGVVRAAQFVPSTISFNTISTNSLDQTQLFSTGQLNASVISTPSTFINQIARISTLLTDTLSTVYVSANNAFFSTLSTHELFVRRLSTPNMNIQSLSANTISTARAYAGFAGVRSTVASTITTTFLVTSTLTNSLISSLFTDLLSAGTIVPSTISTIQFDSLLFQPSTCIVSTFISSGFVLLSNLNTTYVNPPLQGTSNYDQLSAGRILVGDGQASTIRTTFTNPVSSLVTNTNVYSIPTNSNSSITLYYLSTQTSNFTMNESMIFNDQPFTNNVKFVIGGISNAIINSTDGKTNWSSSGNLIPINIIRGIAYARKTNTWLAVGWGTSSNSTMAISYNGSNWSTIANNGLESGAIITSNTGADAAAYSEDQNLWVVVGTGGRIVTSGNGGGSWISRTNAFATPGSNEVGLCVAYSPQQKLWVAGGNSRGTTSAVIQTSPNGINWTSRVTSNGIPQLSYCHGIAYSAFQNLWVAVGSATSGGNYLWSRDGFNWSARSFGLNPAYSVAYSEKQNLWVVCGGNALIRSSDGFNWGPYVYVPTGTTAQTPVHDITYNPELNIWVSVANNNEGWYGWSSNASNWNTIANNNTILFAVATSYSLPTFTSQYLNMDLTSTSVSVTANSLNRFVAFNSTIVLNSTIFTQQYPNEVGINTANPIADLDVNSTINAPLFSSITMNTINVNPGDSFRISTIGTDQVSTQQTFAMRGLFQSLSTGFISSRIVTVSTITNSELIGRLMNVNQISSGLYEGGPYTITGLSTFAISTAVTTSFTVSTNNISTIDCSIQIRTPNSIFVAAGFSNSVLKVSYDGSSWRTVVPIPAALTASDNRLFSQSIPMYNSNENFWVIPTRLTSNTGTGSNLTRGPLYTNDFINFSTMNLPNLPNPAIHGDLNFTRSYIARNNIQVVGCGIDNFSGVNYSNSTVLYFKQDNSPTGLFTPIASNSDSLITFVNQLVWGSNSAGGQVFLGIGGHRTNANKRYIIRSVNGSNWSNVTQSLPFITYGSCIGWDGTTNWVAVGNTVNATTNSSIQISVNNGISWTPVIQSGWGTAALSEPRWIAYGNGVWVVGGDGNATNSCIKYTTSITAASATFTNAVLGIGGQPLSNNLFSRCTSIMWNGTFFTALCTPTTVTSSSALISSNGSNWFYGDPGEPFSSLAFGSYAWGNSGPATINPAVLTYDTLQVSRDSQITSISTTFISTVTVTSQEFQASTVSSILLSSVIGFFSTVAVQGNAFAAELSTTRINATTGYFVNGTPVTSDSNIKTNVTAANLDQCFTTIQSLPLKKFTYKDEYSQGIQDKTQLGFIAQEVQPIFPKSIFPIESEDGSQTILHVTFDQLFMTNYGATQQLMTIAEERQSTITSLYSTVENLQAQLSTLKGNNI